MAQGQTPNDFSIDTVKRLSRVDEKTGCWNWTSCLNQWGYGKLCSRYKHWIAHRFSWSVFNNKEIPKGMFVLHSCDNRKCVNPAHLRLGTHKENMKDMVERKRSCIGDKNTSRKNPHLQVRGSKSHHAKLNEAQVLEIKKMLFAGIKQRIIADLYGVQKTNINNINVGLNWNHVILSDADKLDAQKYKSNPPKDTHFKKKPRIFTPSEVAEIKLRLLKGEKQTDIALDYGSTKYAISDIKRGKSWRSVKPKVEAKGMADLFNQIY